MTEQNLPEVGKTYTFKGQPATVTAVRDSRGRPRRDGTHAKQIAYTVNDGGAFTAGLNDWLRGVS